MSGVTVKFPLEMSDKNSGFDAITTDELQDLVKFNIKNTLLTCPDERTFDEEGYGACLRAYLFEFAESGVIADMESVIRNQLSRFVPYIEIQSLEVTNPQDMVINVKLRYFINEISLNDFIEIQVSY